MIKLYFPDMKKELRHGTEELSAQLGIKLCEEGLRVFTSQKDNGNLTVTLTNGEACISYDRKHHFFRGLGLLVEALKDGKESFISDETPFFTMNGPMFDVSQGNAVINVMSIKKTLRQMALMGLNMLMLYCEDSFDVKAQPYFGYMRSRYSESDIRDCDDYADMFGIELIPCIQTLAHLTDTLKWREFDDIKEDSECLFVGEEKTYTFIRDLLTEATRPFRSKRVHIGMDEAWKLGRGSYLSKHGYCDPTDIMKIHLDRVMEIIRSLGLKPMMWSDMMFRSTYGDYYIEDSHEELPQEIIDSVPSDLSLIYWDYYHFDSADYEKMIIAHRRFSEPVFAGGIWTWIGFCPHWKRTFASSTAALQACKRLGVKEVFVTVWGDNGTEAPFCVNMPGLALYAENGYSNEVTEEKLRKRFEFCTGSVLDDFLALEALDETPGVTDAVHTSYNPSKYLMWQDILTGLFDKNIDNLPLNSHYAALADRLGEAVGRNGDFDEMFRFYRDVAYTLAVKSELGLRITRAYKSGDREALTVFARKEIPGFITRMKALRESHYRLWFSLYKAIGWDVFDMRYGSLLARADSAVRELEDYISGRLDRIEELEEERLPYNSEEGLPQYANFFGFIVSSSRIAPFC